MPHIPCRSILKYYVTFANKLTINYNVNYTYLMEHIPSWEPNSSLTYNKFPPSSENGTFHSVDHRQWCLFWGRGIECIPSLLGIPLLYTQVYHLVSLKVSSSKNFYEFIPSPTRVTCHNHLILFDIINTIITDVLFMNVNSISMQ
jgi:hypothetical protein